MIRNGLSHRAYLDLFFAAHVNTVARHKSSLSAIHDGLRRSAGVEIEDSAARSQSPLRSAQHGSFREPRRRTRPREHYNQEKRSSQLMDRPDRVSKYAGSRSIRDVEHRNFYSGKNQGRAAESPLTVLSIPFTTAASQFLYGTSVVQAALAARSRKLYRLYMRTKSRKQGKEAGEDLERQRKSLLPLKKLAALAGVKITEVGDEFSDIMDRLSEGRPHNGCILEASPLPVPPVERLKHASEHDQWFSVEFGHQSDEELAISPTNPKTSYNSDGWRHPFVLLLDGIKDEGNLGAIIRSAYFLGVDAVFISTRSSATVSPVALKASAGAAEALPLFLVHNPVKFIQESSDFGWNVYAADAPRAHEEPTPSQAQNPIQFVHQTQAPGNQTLLPAMAPSPLALHPTILILGSEGEGVQRRLRMEAKCLVGINSGRPTKQIGLDSLNVSVSAALLIAEFLRKQPHGARQDTNTKLGGLGKAETQEERLF